MRRLLLVTLVASCAALGVAGCHSSSTKKTDEDVALKERRAKPSQARPVVAVIEFGDESHYGEENLGRQALRICETELSKSHQVLLVDRQAMDHVLAEQNFQRSGLTDAATAVQVGRLVNAKYLISGGVTNFGLYSDGTVVMGGLYSKKTTHAKCEVDAKMIDVERGVIVTAWNGNGEATRGVQGSPFASGSMSFDQTLGGRALRAAICKMLDRMLDDIE